ncbi:MAG: polyprenyl diphosphate synthase [Rectinema sp.]
MGPSGIPAHVAVIMDGNRRWAKVHGLPRTEGHREGLKAAKRIVSAAEDSGVRYLSLYAFSTENWKRTNDEVGFLMSLIGSHLSKELDFYRERGIRVHHSGDPEGLPPDIARELDEVAADTAGFERMTVNLAINYGGRDEIVRAMRKATAAGFPPETLDENGLRRWLDQPSLPDPDLLIRTGGEFRISNFLLWQTAYSELYFSEKLWPDFGPQDFMAALEDYSKRDRRFGGAS